tara:strand:+ start:2821 stop:3450 length:630 start_codon:yes stop_codon:yes gene_type:complete
VIVGLAGPDYALAGHTAGQYSFYLPPITNYGNNRKYDSAIITLDSFTATPFDGAGALGNDPAWSVNAPVIPAPHNLLAKLGGLIIQLDVPSSQSQQVTVEELANVHSGGLISIGGFREYIQFARVDVGNILGAVGPAADAYSWQKVGNKSDGVFCGNPFGGKVTMTLSTAIADASRCHLVSVGGVGGGPGGADIGTYAAQFTVEMVASN